MLSGGERNRLLLARLFSVPSNVLVLDEPTNDLDAETLALLEERLLTYSGTILLVSHDRAFLNNVVTSTIVFEGDGRLREYVGGYDDWLRQRKARREPAGRAGAGAVRAAGAAAGGEHDASMSLENASAEPVRYFLYGIPYRVLYVRSAVIHRRFLEARVRTVAPRAPGRKLSYKETKELEALPQTIEALEAERDEVAAHAQLVGVLRRQRLSPGGGYQRQVGGGGAGAG